jgi:hypothetical protein
MLMKKKVVVALVALAILGCIGFVVFKIISQRSVSTSLLTAPFASAPAEVKTQVDQAAAAIKSKDYLASVKALKVVADKGGLSKDQKDGIDRTLNDISGMISAKPGPNNDAVTEVILEIQTKLSE